MGHRVGPKVAAGALAALVLAGCGAREGGGGENSGPATDIDYTDGIVGTQEEAGEPQSGGTLTVASQLEPRFLDPTVTQATGITGGIEMANIYDVLVRLDPEQREMVPQLAEAVEPNDDHTQWTVTLRPDVAFSDGTPLDAAAVVASMKRYGAAEAAPDGALWRDNVASVTAVDDLTVQIDLTGPYPGFVNVLSGGAGMIVHPQAGEGENFRPIGAGPFVVENIRPQEELVLAANPDYWAGAPRLEKVRVSYYTDPGALFENLRGGGVDAGFIRNNEDVDELMRSEQPGYLNMTGTGMTYALNGEAGPTSDVRLRKAIGLALDPQVVTDRAYGGVGFPTTKLFGDYSVWDTDTPGLEHDQEEAKKLVDEVKKDGWDGTLQVVNIQGQTGRDTALAQQGQLEAVGITVEVDLVRGFADQFGRLVGGDYEMIAHGVSLREFDPYPKLVAMLHSHGSARHGAATSPEMDAAIDELKLAADDDAKRAALQKVQLAYNETVPFINGGAVAEGLFWQSDVHQVTPAASSMVLFDKTWKSS